MNKRTWRQQTSKQRKRLHAKLRTAKTEYQKNVIRLCLACFRYPFMGYIYSPYVPLSYTDMNKIIDDK